MLPGRVRSNVLARRRTDWVTITRSTKFDRSFEHSMRPRPPVATAERMEVEAFAAEQQQGRKKRPSEGRWVRGRGTHGLFQFLGNRNELVVAGWTCR